MQDDKLIMRLCNLGLITFAYETKVPTKPPTLSKLTHVHSSFDKLLVEKLVACYDKRPIKTVNLFNIMT